MERRTFLSSLLTGAAGLTAAAVLPVFDPEHALWMPGARTFFDLGATRSDREYFDAAADFSEETDRLCHTLLTSDLITREALAVLKNQLNFASRIHRSYDDQFGHYGAEPGAVIRLRKGDVIALNGVYDVNPSRRDALYMITSEYSFDIDQLAVNRIARVDGVKG